MAREGFKKEQELAPTVNSEQKSLSSPFLMCWLYYGLIIGMEKG